jgi:D-sedoheptulose 7-phosphate isomerase
MILSAETVSVEAAAAQYLSRLAGVLELVPSQDVRKTIELLLATRKCGRRVYIMGNGGSAATATHLVCDLIKTAHVDGFAALRVYALADNHALMTAWANDTAYDRTFAEQVNSLADADDVVIGISASGNSPNIIAGLQAAAQLGARTVALVGFDGGQASRLAEIAIHVPAYEYGLVEDAHSAIGHAMTQAVRLALLAELE